MDIVLLGTGNPVPDPLRAGPSTLVRAGGSLLLVDCGRGVLQRLAAAGHGAGQLSAVLLTHLHSDHITDLGDVITTRWVTTFVPTPLPVFGPAGTQRVVDGTLASLAPDIGYRLAHHDDLTEGPAVDVTEVDGGALPLEGDVRILAAPTDHRPVVPTVGYRIEHGGRAVVLAGDTVPCPGLDELAQGADALVHTVIREDLVRRVPAQRFLDICDYHSTVEQAAMTAAKAGVSTLVLTHQVPAVAPGAEEEWRAIAAQHFDGRIEVGDDLQRIEI